MANADVYYFFNPYHKPAGPGGGRFTTKPEGGGAIAQVPRKLSRRNASKRYSTRASLVSAAQVPISELAGLEDFNSIKHRTDRRIKQLKTAMAVTGGMLTVLAAGSILAMQYTRSRADQERLSTLLESSASLVNDGPSGPPLPEMYSPEELAQRQQVEQAEQEAVEAQYRMPPVPEYVMKRLRDMPVLVPARYAGLPGAGTRKTIRRIVGDPIMLPAGGKGREPIPNVRIALPAFAKDAGSDSIYKLPEPTMVKRPDAPSDDIFDRRVLTIFDVAHKLPAEERPEGTLLDYRFKLRDEIDRTAATMSALRRLASTSPADYMVAHYGHRPTVSQEDVDKFDDVHKGIYAKLLEVRLRLQGSADELDAVSNKVPFSADRVASFMEGWVADNNKLLEEEHGYIEELRNHVARVHQPLVNARAWDLCHQAVVKQQGRILDQLVRVSTYYDALMVLRQTGGTTTTATLHDVMAAQDLVEERRKFLLSGKATYRDVHVTDGAHKLGSMAPPMLSYAAAARVAVAINDEQAKIHKELQFAQELLANSAEDYYEKRSGRRRPDPVEYEQAYLDKYTTKKNIISSKKTREQERARLKAAADRLPKLDTTASKEEQLATMASWNMPEGLQRKAGSGGKEVLSPRAEASGLAAHITDDQKESDLGDIAHIIARQEAGGTGASTLGDAVETNYQSALKEWQEAVNRIRQQQRSLREGDYIHQLKTRLERLQLQRTLCEQTMSDLQAKHPALRSLSQDYKDVLAKVLSHGDLVTRSTRPHMGVVAPKSDTPPAKKSKEALERERIREQASYHMHPDDGRQPGRRSRGASLVRAAAEKAQEAQLRQEQAAQQERDRRNARRKELRAQQRTARLQTTLRGRLILAREAAQQRQAQALAELLKAEQLKKAQAAEERQRLAKIEENKRREAASRQRAIELEKRRREMAELKEKKRKAQGRRRYK